MKHLLTSLLLLLLALLLPATATAYDFEVDGIYYSINGTNATVTHKGIFDDPAYSGSVTIPETVTYNGTTYSVTTIGFWAFYGCYSLTSVTISNSITSIVEEAFNGCSGLTSITIPNSVTSIGQCAFSGCRNLTSLTVANGNTTYDSRNNCNGIIETASNTLIAGCQNTVIPNSVTTIGNYAFNGCSGLTSVTIPNSVISIGDYAFNGCSGLTSVTIPNSVISIGDYAFSECYDLTSVSIPNTVTSIGYKAFWWCSGLTSLTIPNSVTSIGGFAFENCSSLTSVIIPNSVTSIGECAFRRCRNLTSLTFPNSVTSIGVCAFEGCLSLTSVTIPNSVISIGACAFLSCTGLTNVYSYITDLSKVSLGDYVFDDYYEFNDNYDYSGRTLHVMPGMLNAYQTDERWYPCFGKIVEMAEFANSIELDKTAAVIIEGESLQLAAAISPEDVVIKDLAWSSSNPEVAIVDNSGLVSAHSVGTATITVMTTDGSNLSASCVVTVKSLSATECFSMPDGEVLHGETITIPVRMNNEATVLAFQTDIFLPEGFTVATDDDDEPMVMPAGRLTSDHLIVTETLSSGAVRVVCYTPSMQPISGNEGDLFYITVNVPDDAAGDYSIYLRNSRLTTDDFSEVRIPDAGAVINVKTYIPGDVNDTHTVNVADIVTTVRYVMEQNPTPFIFDAADMNGDGEVTVTDIMLIARLIMYPTMNAPRHAPAMVANGDRMSGEDIALTTGETRTVSINLDNEAQYSAFQFDLHLPEGMTASNFCLTDRAASHALEVNTLMDGTIRALCYTPTIEAIDGTSGAVLTFDVTATSPVTGDITVDGIELVTTGCQTVKPAVFNIGVQIATAVNELSVGKTVAKVEYFNLAGQRLTRPASGVTLIVTTYTDGTRTTTKLLH